MNKYIPADKLIAEIERFSTTEYGGNTLGDDIANGALDFVLEEIIPSLQQDQPFDMKSPFTGGKVTIISREEELTFRGEKVKITRKYYRCKDTGREFTDSKLDDDMMWAVFRAYCEKKGITSFTDIMLKQEQQDTCIFGNTPSKEVCKFCSVNCELREPKQTGTTSAGLSSKDEAIGLAIMAYLDTKVKHDNTKVCGVSLKVAREWIREKIANKQEQPEVNLEKELDKWRYDHFKGKRDGDYSGEYLERESQLDLARHFVEFGFNARKEK